MTVLEKIKVIGRGFSFNSYTVFELMGNTGRIIDTVATLKEAQEYVRLGEKHGKKFEIAEYDTTANDVIFH